MYAVTHKTGLKLTLRIHHGDIIPPAAAVTKKNQTTNETKPLSELPQNETQAQVQHLLDILHEQQSKVQKRFIALNKMIKHYSDLLFKENETCFQIEIALMAWREEIVSIAPIFVQALFSDARAATDASADKSTRHGQTMLMDDHLTARKYQAIVKAAHLNAISNHESNCRSIMKASLQIRDLLESEAGPNFTNGIFEHPEINATTLSESKHRYRKVLESAEQTYTRAKTMLEGSQLWLDGVLSGLVKEQSADPFYVV